MPQNLTVTVVGELIVRPNSVLTFAPGTELYVWGELEADDTIDPNCYTIFQGVSETSGCWGGINIYSNSTHLFNHCIIRHAVNNIVIANVEIGTLSYCDIYDAKENGVIYLDGHSHIHNSNMIHDNTFDNVLITGDSTYLTIQYDEIYGAKTFNGISIGAGSYPIIEYCTIYNNRQDGIKVWETNHYINYPKIKSCNIYGNLDDGIEIFNNAQALVQNNTITNNIGNGINVSSIAVLVGGVFYGDDGSNELTGNLTNLHLENHSSSVFGVSLSQNHSYGHRNCFITPSVYQVHALDYSYALVEEDYFVPNKSSDFYNDMTSNISTLNQLPGCMATPIAPRIDSENAVSLNTVAFSMKKTVNESDIIIDSAFYYFRKGDFDNTLRFLDNISLLSSDRTKGLAITVYNLLLNKTGYEKIAQQLKNLLSQGIINDVDIKSLLASYSMQRGMHGKVILLLNDIIPNLTGVNSRNALLRKAYSTTVIYGKDAGKILMSTIRNMYPEDKIVCEFEHYIPWITQREDVVDTLEKKAPIVEKSSTNGYELWNYPNPFGTATIIGNPTTIIKYSLPEDTEVKLSVLDILGREISVLVNEYKSRGRYSVVFDATSLPSGIYSYRLVAGKNILTRSMSLVK